MKIARKHIIKAIERHDETMKRQELPRSSHYVTLWKFEDYSLTVKTEKHGWRVLWYRKRK